MMLRSLITAGLIALATPAWAGDGGDPWREVDKSADQIPDIARLEQLARDFPDSGTVRLRLLQPLLDAGEIEKVMELLEWLYDRGYVFSEVAQQQIPKLLEGVDSGRIAERLRAQAEIVEASGIIARLPAEARLSESVIRSPVSGRLIVSTIIDRAVWYEKPDGTFGRGLSHIAANLSGMAVNASTDEVWVASSYLDGATNAREGVVGLLRVKPGSAERKIVLAEEGVNPSDLTIGPDQTLYASDPIGGGIYYATRNDVRLQTLIEPGTFRSPQGLVTSEDGAKLYISDYRYGIAIVDLETRTVARLASDVPIILDGIDGLWRHGNELIAVQNGTSPMRISAFELSGDGMWVVGHRILEQAHSEWTEPLSGSIDGDALLYIGNGQWDRYVEGKLAQDKVALPTQIRRLPLGLPAE